MSRIITAMLLVVRLLWFPNVMFGSDFNIDDSTTVSVSLNEIQINSLSDKTIIKKSIANLPKQFKFEEKTTLQYYGNGQHIQIIECNGRTVQLSRLYGCYYTDGGSVKMKKFDYFWYLNFYPVYNARSFRYNAAGSSVLNMNSFELRDGNITKAREINYNAKENYVFYIMEVLYKYGPMLNRSYADYDFVFTGMSGNCYRYKFESSSRYPKKNSLYARGDLLIDSDNYMLRSIHIDNIGLNFIDRYPSYDVDCNDERIKQDCIDCDFKINEQGEIIYALIHVRWSPDILQHFTSTSRLLQPRPNASSEHCVVTECWKAESCKRYLDSTRRYRDLTYKVLEVMTERKLSIPTDNEAFEKLYLNILDSGFRVTDDAGMYEASAIASIPWAMDVFEGERQLDTFFPIKEQYKRQSSDELYEHRGDVIPQSDEQLELRDIIREATIRLLYDEAHEESDNH